MLLCKIVIFKEISSEIAKKHNLTTKKCNYLSIALITQLYILGLISIIKLLK